MCKSGEQHLYSVPHLCSYKYLKHGNVTTFSSEEITGEQGRGGKGEPTPSAGPGGAGPTGPSVAPTGSVPQETARGHGNSVSGL